MEEKAINHKHNEGGFILVTAIILLAILMGLGAAAMFKTNVEMKVSASAADTAKAFAAAQAGLDYTYNYWSQDPNGQAEFKAIATAASAGGATGPSILIDKAPASITNLGANATAVDTWVKTSGARVYNLTNAGIKPAASAANWNVDKYAQVAVWTTRFQPSTSGYPYASPTPLTSGACPTCTAVTYVLGRSDNAYKLLREYAFISTSTLQAFGAMMNAPKYKDGTDCATGNTSTSTTVTTPSPVPAGNNWWSHMIDATQAPGGVAMISNNGINPSGSNKDFTNNQGTGTTLTTNGQTIDMWVVYDEGKVAATAPTYPDMKGDKMSTLWSTVVRDSLFVAPNTPMDIFGANTQLFPLDAYREAANRISGFATETINGYSVNTNNTPLTSQVTTLKTNNSGFGRAGTLNWNELKHNIQNSVPMYGLLRFMIPMTPTGNTVSVCGDSTVTEYEPMKIGGVKKVDPIGQGLESPDGKLIVYGGALFDFYKDVNLDGIYQPATESLLTRNEAGGAKKLNVNSPLMFNPVMDGMTPNTGLAGNANTCDVLNINCYPNGAPSSDITANSDGVMDLVWDVDNVARNWDTMVKASGGNWAFTAAGGFRDWMTQESPAVITSTATSGTHAWSGGDKNRMWALLDYYIRTTSQASLSTWSDMNATDIENNFSIFFIDTNNDLIAGQASAADLYHSFLPSGYIHGWKRGLQATGLANVGSDGTNSFWNTDLIQDNSVVDPSPFSGRESKIFNVTGVGANARVDQNFGDIPSEMYSGGLVDMHHAVNISGVVYTPDMLEFEQKKKGIQGTTNGNNGGAGGPQAALQYINALVISGGGVYMKDETGGTNARTVIAYDDTSIDNLPTNNDTLTLGRKYWQELK